MTETKSNMKNNNELYKTVKKKKLKLISYLNCKIKN